MLIRVHEIEKSSLEQIEAFLVSSQEFQFQGEWRADVCAWMGRTLRQQNYPKRGRQEKGLVRGYIQKMTGLSRSQVTRLIRQVEKTRGRSSPP